MYSPGIFSSEKIFPLTGYKMTVWKLVLVLSILYQPRLRLEDKKSRKGSGDGQKKIDSE